MKKKKIIIMGATSGIGREVALIYIKKGWKVGVCGRRLQELYELKSLSTETIEIAQIDITTPNAPIILFDLIKRLGGMDIYFHSSGIGKQNHTLDSNIEIETLRTNGEGFVRMIDTAFNYFRDSSEEGHIVAITSIAGTKGIGVAPSYSATKRFQNTYLQCLSQLIQMKKLNIHITDIRPGFVATNLLNDNYKYPMVLTPERVANKIVKAIEKKRRIHIIDWKYRILTFLWQLIPNHIWEHLNIHTH